MSPELADARSITLLPYRLSVHEVCAREMTSGFDLMTNSFGILGSDLMLINLARETLSSAGWSDKLLTGRNTFEVGGGRRHVAEQEQAPLQK